MVKRQNSSIKSQERIKNQLKPRPEANWQFAPSLEDSDKDEIYRLLTTTEIDNSDSHEVAEFVSRRVRKHPSLCCFVENHEV